ncbi:MAG: hydrogenase maturation protease [Victivallales bacterium]
MKTHAKVVNTNKNIFKKKKSSQVLIYGIGNPSRQDDALGILFTELMREWVESKKLPNIFFDSNYQLNIEDALSISEKDIVIFVDASREAVEDFNFRRLKGSDKIAFSTHSMDPESVLSLCEDLFEKTPSTYLLTIKGYAWDLDAQLTCGARRNLDSALEFMKGNLNSWQG